MWGPLCGLIKDNKYLISLGPGDENAIRLVISWLILAKYDIALKSVNKL